MTKKRCILSAAFLAGALFMPALDASTVGYSGSVLPLDINENTEITLNGATIDARSDAKTAGIEIQPGATLTLNLVGDNYIYGGTCAAGIHVSPKYLNDTEYDANGSAKLIIKGSGNLTVIGGHGAIKNEDTFQCGTGAGIGGNGSYSEWDGSGEAETGTWNWSYGPDFGEITIAEDFTGTLESHSGITNKTMDYHNNENDFDGGAGIGGGGTVADSYSPDWHEVLSGKINIHNGTIIASGLTDGDDDGIGGGAGIGSGSGRGDGAISKSEIEINITGGTITATGGYLGAGIGGGSNQNSGDINISGGTIVAHYGPIEENFPSPSGAGIGAGDCGSISTINITGGDITATGLGSAGIGGGYEGTWAAKGAYDTTDDWGYPDSTNPGQINISGANTKVVAIGESILDDEDYPRIKSGAGIGTGAPYQSSNIWYAARYTVNITDHADVTAIGGEYANGIGLGGTRKGDNIIRESGVAVTIDDTVKLFATNNSESDQITAITENNYYDNYRNVKALTFISENKFLVLHDGEYLDAYNNLPESEDALDADYAISNNTLTVTVEGNNPTTHTLPTAYTANRNFAVISGQEAINYCSITLQHIDSETGLSIIDDITTSEGAVCDKATLEIKASDEVLEMGYEVEGAIDNNDEDIELPYTAINTEDGMIYKIFYKAIETPEDTPEEDETPENADTSDSLVKITPIIITTLFFATASAVLIKKNTRR